MQAFDGFRRLSLYFRRLPRPLKGPILLEFEPLDQFQQRRKKLHEIEALGLGVYPHKYSWTHTPKQAIAQFGERSAEQLSAERVALRVAGRIVALRPHGKAAFGHILGDGKRLQFTLDWPAFKAGVYPKLKPALQKKFPSNTWV